MAGSICTEQKTRKEKKKEKSSSPCRTSTVDSAVHTCRCWWNSPPYRRSTVGSGTHTHTHKKVIVGRFTGRRLDGSRRTTHLQVRDVPVDVHGRGDAVLRDVLEAVGVRLAVHAVDAGDGDSLLAQSDVTANTVEAFQAGRLSELHNRGEIVENGETLR